MGNSLMKKYRGESNVGQKAFGLLLETTDFGE